MPTLVSHTLRILASAMLCLPIGCASVPTTLESTSVRWRVAHQAGGVHHRLLIQGDVWYQTRRDLLLVIDPTDGNVLREVQLGDPGSSGLATDLLLCESELFVVLRDDGVVRLDVDDPLQPRVVETIDARTLEILPRRLSLVGGELYVSGEGGVVRLADRRRLFAHLGVAGPVVESTKGLVTTIDRRVYRLDDQEYVGSASVLHELPDGYGIPGLFVFVRHGDGRSDIGLMTPVVRELNVNTATVTLDEMILNVRFFRGLIWAVTERGLRVFRADSDRLRLELSIDRAGLLDVGDAGVNWVAICGTFGRGVMRLRDDGRNPGQVMIWQQASPGRIVRAQSDGQHIRVFDGAHHWLYDVRSNDVRRDAASSGDDATDQLHAVTLAAQLRIEDEGRSALITTGQGVLHHVESERSRIHCVIAVAGIFWLGHDRGVTMIDPQCAETIVVGQIRLPGRIMHLMPLLAGNGAAYVSETGGLGVIRARN